MKIFLDSDVILDVVLKRSKFFKDATKLFNTLNKGKVKGFTSPIIFANVCYVFTRLHSKERALEALKKLRIFLQIIPANQKIIDLSLASGFPDFEDAIQYYSALEFGIDQIITRNKKDYKKSAIPILSPKEFNQIL